MSDKHTIAALQRTVTQQELELLSLRALLVSCDERLDELGCGACRVPPAAPTEAVPEAVGEAMTTMRRALAAERAAHLATRQELSMALAERAYARAEVERLRGLLADAERHAQERHRERGRDRQAIEIERLREALRLRGQHSRECDRLQGREVRCVCGLDAALAGSPVEGGGQPQTPRKLDERRALAERVREACAEADDFNADAADGLRCAIRALDLDALLDQEEP